MFDRPHTVPWVSPRLRFLLDCRPLAVEESVGRMIEWLSDKYSARIIAGGDPDVARPGRTEIEHFRAECVGEGIDLARQMAATAGKLG